MKDFKVYDAMLAKKPSTGLLSMPVWYRSSLFAAGSDEVDESALSRLAPAGLSGPVTIDIEHWERDEPNIDNTIEKFQRVLSLVRSVNPDLKIGLYSALPRRRYWPSVWGPLHALPSRQSAWLEWVKQNFAMRVLGEEVDFIAPSLYTFYKNIPQWEVYAGEHLWQAKQYGGKPVYAFLCPQYHFSGNQPSGSLVDGIFWKRQLELCYRLCDGVVIWTNEAMSWNEDAPWWMVTKQFLEQTHRGVI